MNQHHPWSLHYLYIWAYTRLLRFLVLRRFPASPPYENPKVVRTEGTVPSREKGRAIRVIQYRPLSAAPEEALPILINFHGAGFIIPRLGAEQEFCSMVAERLGWLVIDCDYRKAPEYPFPWGLEDAEDAALHILEHIPHKTISTSGFSSGGSIALGLAIVLGPDRIRSTAAFYPSTNIDADTHAQSIDPPLPPSFLRHIRACYVVPGTSITDPRISPAYASKEELPRHLWLGAGAVDPLHDAAKVFMERIQKEGHPDAVFRSIGHTGHGFVPLGPESAGLQGKAKEMREEAMAFLQRSVQQDL
ncbi:Alpha/Beta hydrolase protein [Roridomyces roridus]|uniref:Alpha/Beta hydrolase protein n=1 Tax=Roridomyces roridus TaxID=1738132 RepID=A0AAD7AYS7_9AGAR|nr:Alpha/Beta hydrolase protein [Roridomyces roridus]